MYSCNSIHPKYTILINLWKCPRTALNGAAFHLDPILQLIATSIQDNCSPWKKCDLFVPESDSSANRNVEIESFISDTHIFRMGIKNQASGKKLNWNFCTHVHIHTHIDTHKHKHKNSHLKTCHRDFFYAIYVTDM